MRLETFLEPFESSEEVLVHLPNGREIVTYPESKELELFLRCEVTYACPRIGGIDWAYTYIEVGEK